MDETLVKNRFISDEFAEKLESFKAEIFFPNLTPPDNINQIIQKVSSANLIKTLSITDIAENMVLLSSYSLFLTKEENRLNAYINWCESNIKFIVGQQMNQISGYFQEKDLFIRSNDTNAIKLGELKLIAEVKLNSIKFIAQKISYLSDKLESFMFARKKEYDKKQ
jgi:hypothetical protein